MQGDSACIYPSKLTILSQRTVFNTFTVLFNFKCTECDYMVLFTNMLVALKRAGFGRLSGDDVMRADIALQCGVAD